MKAEASGPNRLEYRVQWSGAGDDDDFTTLVAQLLFGRPGSTWEVVSAGP